MVNAGIKLAIHHEDVVDDPIRDLFVDLEGKFGSAARVGELVVEFIEFFNENRVSFFILSSRWTVICLEAVFLFAEVPTGIKSENPQNSGYIIAAMAFVDGVSQFIESIYKIFVLVIQPLVSGAEGNNPFQAFRCIH